MEIDNLIKKLESARKPEIELPGHKEKLRRFLLFRHQNRQTMSGLNILWRTMPAGLSFIVVSALILNNFVSPRLNIALAKEIAYQDQEVKSLIERGAIIKEVQLSDSRGFLLFQVSDSGTGLLQNEAAVGSNFVVAGAEGKAPSRSQTSAFLVEVDLKGRRIAKIEEKVMVQSPLEEMEIVRAKEIMEEDREIKQAVKDGAKVKEVKKASPQAQLVRKGARPEITIEVLPTEGTFIIYEQDAKVWRGKVDLQAGDIKAIDFFEINN